MRNELTDEWQTHGVEKGREYAILTDEITKAQNPQGLGENLKIAHTGGKIAGDARAQIEGETGKPVITGENAVQLNRVVTDLIEGVAQEGKPSENES